MKYHLQVSLSDWCCAPVDFQHVYWRTKRELWHVCWRAMQHCTTVLFTRAATRPTLRTGWFKTRVLTREATLNYWIDHTCRKSTEGACGSLCDTCVDVHSVIALLNCPHVSKIDQRCTRSICDTCPGLCTGQLKWPTLCIGHCDWPVRRLRATCVCCRVGKPVWNV